MTQQILNSNQNVTSAPLSNTIDSYQPLQQEMMIASPMTPPAAHTKPTMMSVTLTTPTPVVTSALSPSPAVVRIPVPIHDDNDHRSEVSSLRCGSVPPNIHYDPAKDPFLLPYKPFVPPLEIEVPIKVRKTEEQEQEFQPPEWLALPETNGTNKKKKAICKKDKQQRSKRRLVVGGRRRRSRSLSEERDGTNVDLPQSQDELHRSYSQESPAVAQQQDQQRLDEALGLPTATTHHRSNPQRHSHRRTVSMPSSSPFRKIGNGRNGRPVPGQQDADREKEERVATSSPQLSPVRHEIRLPAAQPTTTTTTPFDLSNFYCPSDSKEALKVETSGSFADSTQTTPTSSSSTAIDNDGVAVMPLPLMEPLDDIPEERKANHNATAATNKQSSSSPRKGMVRREFQRRFLWFTNHSRKSKKEDLQKLCSTMV